eukprot:11184333-Lingulodinium_polyedra.AAC.1
MEPEVLHKGDTVRLRAFTSALIKARLEDKLWDRRALLYLALAIQLNDECKKKRLEFCRVPSSRPPML